MAKYTITLSCQGGSGTPSTLYYSSNSGRFFYEADDGSTVYVTAADKSILATLKPTYTCFSFKGFYTAKTGGEQFINSAGEIKASFFAAAEAGDTDGLVLFAKWTRISYRVTFDRNGGTGGTSVLFTKDDTSETLYTNSTCSSGHEATSITPPTYAGRTYAGHRARTDGGSTYTNAAGSVTSNLRTWAASGNKSDLVVYANWTENFYRLHFDRGGGTGGVAVLYVCKDKDGAGLNSIHRYSSLSDNSRIAYDSDAERAAETCETPTRTGYDFAGYRWTNPSTGGGATYMNSDGYLLSGVYTRTFSEDLTIEAQWTAHVWTLSFDLHGGSGTAAAKSVTFGSAIGALPLNPTRSGYVFEGWYIDSVRLTTNTKWKWDSDCTAVARWRGAFGDVTDYFNLDDGTRLVAISSQGNETLPRVDTLESGRFAASEVAASPLLSPSVTYAIVGTLDISSVVLPNITTGIVLGKAYSSGDYGYMITSVSVSTAAGTRPTLTVSATANEGADAINLWPVDFWQSVYRVLARSKAQNIGNAIAIPSGARLVALTFTARCEPVVIMERLVPVASDVVRGCMEVSATVIQPTLNADKPSAATGWELISCDKSGADTSYRSFDIAVRKAL